MKKIVFTLFMPMILMISGCSGQTEITSTHDITATSTPIATTSTPIAATPTPIAATSTPAAASSIPNTDIQDALNETDTDKEIYCFDATKEWDANEYKKRYGMELNYFSAPIQCPYKYTYKCDSNISIDKVADELGNIMLKDFMRDYEGKTFIVTEYRNLAAHIMNEEEYKEWKERYDKNVKPIELSGRQWLCTFSCEYKYTGVYSCIGEMPADLEWMNSLATDGSGENYVFMIQKLSEEEYVLRALPKTVMERKID